MRSQQPLGCTNPKSSIFFAAPPHFALELEHKKVRERMSLTFGKILEHFDEHYRKKIMILLLLSLDSIIYYPEELH